LIVSKREVFVSLFDEHWVPVRGFIKRRMTDMDEAEDLASEVFRIAWEKLDPAAPFGRAWLFATARNVLGTHYRGRRRGAEAEDALARLVQEPPVHVGHDALLDLEAGMRALSDRDREVIMLTYWDGLSAAEAAVVLGTTTGAVWVTLTRARAKLRAVIADTPAECVVDGSAR
jgi:RNA polymerase sigma-70 factor (ECF subfamily)